MTISESVSDPARDWRRNQAAVTGATFIGFTGFTLVMPFLPLYFEQLGVKGAGIAVWSGISLGITPAVTAAMAPVWARMALRFGRKLMVARSLGSFVIIMALMGMVTAPWQVFVLRAIQGFFAGYGPIALTMAAESAPQDQIATAIGWVQTAQRLGPALGPVIGGSLALTIGIPHTFFVSSGVYVLAFLLVIVGYRESHVRMAAHLDAGADRVTFRALAKVPHFVLLMATVFGLQLVDRSLGPILPLYLRDLGFADARVPLLSGILFTVIAGFAAVGNQTSGWLLNRRPAGFVVPAMAAVAALPALVFGASAPLVVLVSVGAVFGYALGAATTCTYTAATHRLPHTWRGIAFGYLTSAYLIGLAVSPVVAGFIGALSTRAVFVADGAGLAVLAWIVRRGMTRGDVAR